MLCSPTSQWTFSEFGYSHLPSGLFYGWLPDMRQAALRWKPSRHAIPTGAKFHISLPKSSTAWIIPLSITPQTLGEAFSDINTWETCAQHLCALARLPLMAWISSSSSYDNNQLRYLNTLTCSSSSLNAKNHVSREIWAAAAVICCTCWRQHSLHSLVYWCLTSCTSLKGGSPFTRTDNTILRMTIHNVPA